MRWYSFLSRVALICNVFFVLSALLQWRLFIRDEALVSTIAVTGYFLAPAVFNPLANLSYLVLLFQKKRVRFFVPLWLAVTNFIFLLIQVFFVLFFLHDSFHS